MPKPKGSKKVGGRQKGTPNRRKQEDIERKRIEAENAARALEIAKEERTPGRGPLNGIRKKLAKDVIEDFMMIFMSQAARYQPMPPPRDEAEVALRKQRGVEPDEDKFLLWSKPAIEAARALAEYQSPKLRAHLLTMPGSEGGGMKTIDENGNNVIPLKDPIAAARVYARIMKTVQG